MEDQRIIYLYNKFIDGTAKQEEVYEFHTYLINSESEQHLLALLEKVYPDQESLLKDINPLSKQRIFSFIITQDQKITARYKKAKLWPKLVTVAASLAIIFTWFYLFNFQQKDNSKHNAVITPGKIGATLTLASGKKISLSSVEKGTFVQEKGLYISKTEIGEIVYNAAALDRRSDISNTLSTANGEMYTVVLPDKSKVYLNAASTITYPVSFSGHDERLIKLSGEAYFEIAKDRSHPFIVETVDQKITVFGTHFNVSAYPDEKTTETTLLEGSVQVGYSSGNKQSGIVIKPGELAYIKNGNIAVEHVVAQDAIAWQQGYFRFNNETMEVALNKIARWYDVRIIYMDQDLRKQNVYGSLSRFSNINDILKILELTNVVKFKVVGKEITAFKK